MVQLFKAGLAYRKAARVNYCPSCKTVLADEQVMSPAQAGKLPPGYTKLEDVPEGTLVCERCGHIPEMKDLEQWFFRITDYADRLLEGLKKIDWSSRVSIAQANWIGKKGGIEITYDVVDSDEKITVFTTTPVNWGATFMVIAPEHSFVNKILDKELKVESKHYLDIKKYVEKAVSKTDQQRKVDEKEKTGVFTGFYVKNHVTGESLPIWIADFVLKDVGTGAVQGCPGHDERDFEFASKYNIPIPRVVVGPDGDDSKIDSLAKVIVSGMPGKMINSGFLNGLEFADAMQKTMDYFEKKGWGKRVTTYHLRDWLIGRQRYWGTPIPFIFCKKCAEKGKSYLTQKTSKLIRKNQDDWDHAGWWPAQDLPIELPRIKDYQPKGEGEGPLANHPDFYNVKCPECGSQARRETDVADTFVDSSWYFLRYPSVGLPDGDTPFDPQLTKKWLPLSLYFGGAEHAVLHLMYCRFITMVLKDLNYLDFEEPAPKFYAHGLMIKDGAKMSKSRGNVVNPDDYIKKYGADTLRLYLMFMGPMDGYPDFRDEGIEGMSRFLVRVWNLLKNHKNTATSKTTKVDIKMHQTIKKVTEDIQNFRYNTAIAAIMEYVNTLRTNKKSITNEHLTVLAQLIAPFAPHMAEEAWEMMGEKYSIHTSKWPKFDAKVTREEQIVIAVQVNGKLRGQVKIAQDDIQDENTVTTKAKKDSKVAKWLTNKKIKNTIYVRGKVVNFVV